MADYPIPTCCLCGGKNHKTCPCPWGKPFDEWPSQLRDKVRSMTSGGPFKGS